MVRVGALDYRLSLVSLKMVSPGRGLFLLFLSAPRTPQHFSLAVNKDGAICVSRTVGEAPKLGVIYSAKEQPGAHSIQQGVQGCL